MIIRTNQAMKAAYYDHLLATLGASGHMDALLIIDRLRGTESDKLDDRDKRGIVAACVVSLILTGLAGAAVGLSACF